MLLWAICNREWKAAVTGGVQTLAYFGDNEQSHHASDCGRLAQRAAKILDADDAGQNGLKHHREPSNEVFSLFR